MVADNAALESSELGAMSIARPARANPLANRNFRLLWVGENISLLGDQFYFVALPWLVLQLTGSVLALGTILMVAGVPRAVFTLVGGVLADRFSPRTMMLASNLARFVITVVLVAIAALGALQVWMIYAIALCFGVVDAFFYPAFMSMAPTLLDDEQLPTGNAAIQGSQQVAQAIGPGIAGVVVASLGAVLSFALDAFSFLFSSVMLLLMDVPPRPAASNEAKRAGMVEQIKEMFATVWCDPPLRAMIVIVVIINFLMIGPLSVGPAALARDRFAEGPVAMGFILSSFGVGSVLGMVTAGLLRPKRFGPIIAGILVVTGLTVAGLGLSWLLPLACLMGAICGFTGGFCQVLAVTWLQRRVAKEMMGRVMGLLMLALVGLAPLSQAMAGFGGEFNLTALFVGSGALLVAFGLLTMGRPEVRQMTN